MKIFILICAIALPGAFSATLQEQCLAAWGSDAGDDACFSLNTRGDQFGNCGQTSSGQYVACDSSDVMCGQLHCMDGSYTGVYGVRGTTTRFTIGLSGGNNVFCRAFTSTRDLNAGQVAEGTSCGRGGVCTNGQCVGQSTAPQSHQEQCAAVFGSDDASSACYAQNTRGDAFGNCGQSSPGVYVPCDANDVLCGQLMCAGSSYTGIFGVQGSITSLFLSNENCYGFTSTSDLDAGQVAEGTSCGQGKVCTNGKCV